MLEFTYEQSKRPNILIDSQLKQSRIRKIIIKKFLNSQITQQNTL